MSLPRWSGGLLAAALLAACGGPRPMTLRAQPPYYSPAMSSATGIRLTPIFEPPRGKVVRYRWKTNFGGFVSAGTPFREFPELVQELELEPASLYWTYDARKVEPLKPPVRIVVEAVDESGAVLARASLRLDWDHDTAHARASD